MLEKKGVILLPKFFSSLSLLCLPSPCLRPNLRQLPPPIPAPSPLFYQPFVTPTSVFVHHLPLVFSSTDLHPTSVCLTYVL